MELNFERIDNLYVAEFEVASDFNLHIERDTEGRLDIYQRTAGGQYEYINDIGWLNRRLVYDYDFTALVYPKYIKIVTSVLPLVATITTDGEVNELKYQEKSVEITSNGTTKVTPDAGYNGLALVNVKVNVEGGTGGGYTDDGELKLNDVNFFDYDGTLLYSYSWDEAKELTELPALPVHDGLEVREWNYTLEDIKEQGTETTIGKADIGACVYDRDGELISVPSVYIVERGAEPQPISLRYLRVVSLPNTIEEIPDRTLYKCNMDLELKIPIATSYVGDAYATSFEVSAVRGVYWNGVDRFPDFLNFNETFYIGRIPENVVNLKSSDFYGSLVILPSNLETIDAYKLGRVLDFSNCKKIPTKAWGYRYEYFAFIVPDELYDEWCNSTNWAESSDIIIKKSEYYGDVNPKML